MFYGMACGDNFQFQRKLCKYIYDIDLSVIKTQSLYEYVFINLEIFFLT